MSEKHKNYTIALIELVFKEINGHICGPGIFFFLIYNPEDVLCAASTKIKQHQYLFVSLNCMLNGNFLNPILHGCV